MFKRIVLSFAFIWAIGAAGLGMGSKAMAWDDCRSSYRAAYYPTYPAYTYVPTYAPAPRVVAYRAPIVVRDRGFYDDHHHHHHHDHDHNFISFSFGF